MTTVSQSTSVSQSSSLLRAVWPKLLPMLQSVQPLRLVRERSAAKLAQKTQRREQIAQLVHAQIIPQILSRNLRGQAAMAEAPTATASNLPLYFSPDELKAAAALALQGDEPALLARVHELLDSGMRYSEISEYFIRPTAQYLGECWVEDSVNFSEVTLACVHLQSVLRHLHEMTAATVAEAANSLQVLLLTAPKEQHTLGLMMVAESFRRDGWQVSQANEQVNDDKPPLQFIKQQWFDVVGISIGSDKQLPWLKQFISDLRLQSLNQQVKVLAGGAVLSEHPEKAQQCGADACATNACDTPALAKKMLTHVTIPVSVNLK